MIVASFFHGVLLDYFWTTFGVSHPCLILMIVASFLVGRPIGPSDQSDAIVAGFLYMFLSIGLFIYISMSCRGFRPRFHSVWFRPSATALSKRSTRAQHKHNELPASSFSIMCSKARMYEINYIDRR